MPRCILYLGIDLYQRIIRSNDRSRYPCTPCTHSHVARKNQPHGTIQAGSRIPAGTLGQIFKPHGKTIITLFQIRSNIDIKRRIAVSPTTYLFTIDINDRPAHRSIENQCCPAPRRYGKRCPIPPYADIRQRSGTSGFLRRNSFSVLLYGNDLLVYFLIERSVNGPIMRDLDTLPATIVECRISST